MTILPLTLAMLLTTACGTAPTESGGSTPASTGSGSVSEPSGGQTLTVLLSEEPSDEDSLGNMLKLWEAETACKYTLQATGKYFII